MPNGLSLSVERNSPEPQEDVDLFVDDVLGENAEAVLVLDSTGGTVLVERALRHLLSIIMVAREKILNSKTTHPKVVSKSSLSSSSLTYNKRGTAVLRILPKGNCSKMLFILKLCSKL
jgi:hypothetical protein